MAIAGWQYLPEHQYREEVALARKAYQDWLDEWSAKDPSGQGSIVDQAVRAWNAARPVIGVDDTGNPVLGGQPYPIYYTKYNRNPIPLLQLGEEGALTANAFGVAIPG